MRGVQVRVVDAAKWKPKCSFIEKTFFVCNAKSAASCVFCFVSHAAARKMVSIVLYYSKQGATREKSSIWLATQGVLVSYNSIVTCKNQTKR